ncbi:hypothetical protein PRIPAC_72587 [Pristionchus pacificus]|uniref:Uncharacterized protein n=1 Tax=Pristionchus pacificus TaxID=54126 RepID=A0A2A6C9L7_PRIPA|nr:hypothetical protein PRIPAC_72587 [Pristionchus pacificus]|eukprot:PDM74902.1 hypothetical protein PRIPAC_40283 [Pristionchus pacificus]
MEPYSLLFVFERKYIIRIVVAMAIDVCKKIHTYIMSSQWSMIIRIVTSIECFLIFAVHGLFLLLVILKEKMSRSFRIVLFINVIHGILFGIIILLVSSGHVFHNGHFAIPLFGPLIPILPKVIQDASMVSLTVLCYMIWQLIPAPLIMQYLALIRS